MAVFRYVLEHAAKNRFENFGPIDGLGASSSTNPLLLPPWVVAQKTRPLQGLLDGIRDKKHN